MIRARYYGNLGNHMFQYALARILHEETGQKLAVPPVKAFPNATQLEGVVYEDQRGVDERHLRHWLSVARTTPSLLDVKCLAEMMKREKFNLKIRGYWQNYQYYADYTDSIIDDWFYIPGKKDGNLKRDVLLTIRLGDYIKLGYTLAPSFYLKAAKSLMGPKSKVFIISDQPDHPYMQDLSELEPTIFRGTPIEQLSFAKTFDKIVLSESTFSWWAAFLARGKEVIFPQSPRGPWGPRTQIHLKLPSWITMEGDQYAQ